MSQTEFLVPQVTDTIQTYQMSTWTKIVQSRDSDARFSANENREKMWPALRNSIASGLQECLPSRQVGSKLPTAHITQPIYQ